MKDDETMAVCDLCDREMLTADSCVADATVFGGKRHVFGRFGTERGWGRAERCWDCNVRRGGLHHVGCDIQECPACGGQYISCGCYWTSDDDDDQDEPPLFAGDMRVG